MVAMTSDDLLGQSIAGRYRIISRLGAGGMGVAYRAWDEASGVPVVIKIIAALLIWYIRIEADRGSVRDELLGRRVAGTH